MTPDEPVSTYRNSKGTNMRIAIKIGREFCRLKLPGDCKGVVVNLDDAGRGWVVMSSLNEPNKISSR